MCAATWFCMVPAYSVNKQAGFRLKPNNRVKVHFCNEKDGLKWLERKKEEEKGGISKERRKWRWDHHVYLSWQRFHTSSLNQRSIEQTGISQPMLVVLFSFWNISFVTVYVEEWKTKTCGFFCLKELIFFLFFRDHFDKSDRNFLF